MVFLLFLCSRLARGRSVRASTIGALFKENIHKEDEEHHVIEPQPGGHSGRERIALVALEEVLDTLVASQRETYDELDKLNRRDKHSAIAPINQVQLRQEVIAVHQGVHERVRQRTNPSNARKSAEGIARGKNLPEAVSPREPDDG